MLTVRALLATLLCLPLAGGAAAQGKKPTPAEQEQAYYKLLRFEPPPGEVLEAGAIESLPDGKVAVGTRRGEVWLIENAYADDPEKVKFRVGILDQPDFAAARADRH